jgi:hypothetical protein
MGLGLVATAGAGVGLPLAANTGMDTLFAGFAFAVIDHAATRSLVTSRVRSRNGKRNAP